jgi:hypothetical protein
MRDNPRNKRFPHEYSRHADAAVTAQFSRGDAD